MASPKCSLVWLLVPTFALNCDDAPEAPQGPAPTRPCPVMESPAAGPALVINTFERGPGSGDDACKPAQGSFDCAGFETTTPLKCVFPGANEREKGWAPFCGNEPDPDRKGSICVDYVPDPDNSSERGQVLRLAWQLRGAGNPFSGFSEHVGNAETGRFLNAESFSSLTFWARSAGPELDVEISLKSVGCGSQEVETQAPKPLTRDFPGNERIRSQWQKMRIPLRALLQAANGAVDLRRLFQVNIAAARNREPAIPSCGVFYIDDIQLEH